MPEPDAIWWPRPLWSAPAEPLKEDSERRAALLAKLEDALRLRWKRPVLLMPSARSAIAHVLRIMGVGRAHVLFAPKWSSHCVWDMIGRFGNPTCVADSSLDIVLAVHRYGRPAYGPVPKGVSVIEDACDALILPDGNPFPNNGRFAVLSLPKIAGMWCGGILLSASDDDDARARALRDAQPFDALARRQGLRRWQAGAGCAEDGAPWGRDEYRNVHLDLTALDHLSRYLEKGLELSARTIGSRLKVLKRHSSLSSHAARWVHQGWLPPVIPIPSSDPMAVSLVHLQQRQVSLEDSLFPGEFTQCRLIPLHAGFSDKDFTSILTALS